MVHLIGHAKNGIPVHVDLIGSSGARQIAQQPQLLTLMAEALKQTSLHGPRAVVERDMGRAIGYDFVVSTSESDTVFYCQTAQDDTYTRFIKNGKPAMTQFLTITLRRSTKSLAYDLLDVRVGRINPPRPGATDETPESRPYWANHAIVFGGQTLQPRTITKKCPY
jgi:hypothetical protein